MNIRTNIIFLYADSLRRDFSTCFVLEKKLREKGFKTFICSRRNFIFFLRFIIPKKIFLIGQVDMINDKIASEAVKGNSEIHFMPAEGFARDHEYQVMYPKKRDFNFLTTILFWGQNSMNWFKNNRKIDDLLKLKKTGYARSQIGKHYAKRADKISKKIGFIGRFLSLNDIYKRSTIDFFLTEPSDIERDKVVGRITSESKALNSYLRLFYEIVSNTDYTISFRPHPNEDEDTYILLKKIFGNRFEINKDFDVSDFMSKCSVIVGQASSSYIDAYLMKVPVICVDQITGSVKSTILYDPALEDMYSSCYNPKSYDELFSLINDNKLQPIVSKKLDSYLDNDFKGNSDNVFEDLVNAILSSPTKVKIWDYFILKTMVFIDFLLVIRRLILSKKHKNSLMFDYSYFYHSISDTLKIVAKNINKNIK